MTDLAQVLVCMVALTSTYSLGCLMGRGRRLSTAGLSEQLTAFLRYDEQARKNWYAAMVKNGVYQSESPSTSDRNPRDPK